MKFNATRSAKSFRKLGPTSEKWGADNISYREHRSANKNSENFKTFDDKGEGTYESRKKKQKTKDGFFHTDKVKKPFSSEIWGHTLASV